MSNANPIRKAKGAYFSRVNPIALLSSSKLSRSSSLRSRQVHGARNQSCVTERLMNFSLLLAPHQPVTVCKCLYGTAAVRYRERTTTKAARTCVGVDLRGL